MFKEGQKVYMCDKENGEFTSGIVTKIAEDEATFEYHNGSTCSPVSLENCEAISDNVFDYMQMLEKSSWKFNNLARKEFGLTNSEE